METKLLLNQNREQAEAFAQSLKDVITRANELLTLWHKFQEWDVITTQDQAFELLKDPIGRLDKFLLDAVNIKATGTTRLNASAIAGMLNVDYQSWQNIIEGREPALDCIPCRGVRMKSKGVPAITFEEVWYYSNFLTFKKGQFVAITETVKEHQESMKVYAESPEAIATMEHWQELARSLNAHAKRGYLGASALQTIAQLTGLKYVYDTRELFIDESKVLMETLKKQ